jgi:flavin-dependent dehydrogenase
VAICGGGVAGLTLALQLKEARPATSILVVEKNQHPVPEAAHKVGESTVEIGARYLRDVLHLEDYLREHQLDKFGLRMFCSNGDNRDITRRPELGARKWTDYAVGSYQLDRGRLENALAQDLAGHGIAFHGGCRVQEITLRPQDEYHRLSLLMDGSQAREVDARWIVDASGRASLLKRQLGLAKKVGHEANAVWFRVRQRIDIGQWSDDPEWLGRIAEGRRELSTNHLMGPGYWVWLIPLASGSTSVGIVTDAHMHRFEEMNRLDRAMEWLREHEPQCAQMVEPYLDQIQDFRVLRNYAYGCKQVYSASRWCLTGEAGAFLDPFYSPGMDMIAISNSLVTDLVVRALDGADIRERAAVHNHVYLLLFDGWLKVYEQQYGLMGSARVMLTKIVWDTAVYWAIPGLLSFHDKWRDLVDSPPLVAALARFSEIGARIQRFFREWHAVDHSEQSVPFVSFYDFDFTARLHVGMAADLSGTDLVAQVAVNLRLIEQVAGQLVSTVMAECSAQPGNAEMREQVERWKGDSSLAELVEIYEMESPRNPIGDEWIAFKRSTMSG